LLGDLASVAKTDHHCCLFSDDTWAVQLQSRAIDTITLDLLESRPFQALLEQLRNF